jgi:hypothetical protein
MSASSPSGFESRIPGLESVFFRPERADKAPKITLVFESAEKAKQAHEGVRKQAGFVPQSIFPAQYHDHTRYDLLEVVYCPRSNYSNKAEDRTVEGQTRVRTFKAKSAASGYVTIGKPIETTDQLFSKLYCAMATHIIDTGSLLEKSKDIQLIAFQSE